MRIFVVTDDDEILSIMNEMDAERDHQLTFHNRSHDPLDISSSVCSNNPGVLILDDDYTKPNSARILTSIQKVMKNCDNIFITSNPSIDLGRDISQLGIHFYAIKPVAKDELKDSLKSLTKLKSKQESNYY